MKLFTKIPSLKMNNAALAWIPILIHCHYIFRKIIFYPLQRIIFPSNSIWIIHFIRSLNI